MPLSALYEARLHHRGRKSDPGMHRGPGRPRTHSPATRRGRGGGPSSYTATTPRAIASILSSSNGSTSARRGAGSPDVPSGSESLVEGATGADKPQRKPKKKGWKGWAMVYYDDDGNVLEERMRDETPPEDRSTLSPAPELRVSRENTAAMSDVIPVKRPHNSSSPPSTLPAQTSSDSVAAAPDPVIPEVAEPAVVPVRVRTEDVAPPTKRRKTSPVSTPRPDASRANSVVPRSFPAPAPAKAKAPRQSNSLAGTARTLAAAAAVREREREAASARVTPTHVVEDDAPLPKVPRVGMGEGPFPVPSESDLRHEALYIIEAAKRHREQLALREQHRPAPAINGQNGHHPRLPPSGTARHRLTPPLTGEQYRSAQPYDADYDQPYHTPAYTARPRPTSAADDVDGDPFMSSGPSSLRGDQRNRGQPSRPPIDDRRDSLPDEDGDEEFESRFASIQDSYASAAATSDAGRRTSLIRPDDPRPPKFHQGQEPTVLLAPNANDIASLNKRGKNDRHEKAYIEGFEGISEEHEENIRRFVDNVRLNLVSLADHYFPVPGPRRDALLEATGRELQKFGLFLTDDAEGALQLR